MTRRDRSRRVSLTLVTSPHGRPCNVITVNRSFFTAASSAASADAAKHAANHAANHAAAKFTTLKPSKHLRITSPGSRGLFGTVIPAKAGIHFAPVKKTMDSRFRGNDGTFVIDVSFRGNDGICVDDAT
jgi:hypothetical protein